MQEWLSGRYSVDQGYPTPSMMVLVDTVEHSAGGGHNRLAKELVHLKLGNEQVTDNRNRC